MSDKCREAWERFQVEPHHEESTEFAIGAVGIYSHQYRYAVGFHAGYHARPIPSADDIEAEIDGKMTEKYGNHWNERDSTTMLSRTISEIVHRLMVEGGE